MTKMIAPDLQTKRWPPRVGAAVVLSVIVALGIVVYVRASDAPPKHPVASTPRSPSPSGSDDELSELDPIPSSCQELLDGSLPSPPSHDKVVFTNGPC
jgi:hypothetical protein